MRIFRLCSRTWIDWASGEKPGKGNLIWQCVRPCNSVTGIKRQTFIQWRKIAVLLQLFRVLVRPRLECCTQFWSPFLHWRQSQRNSLSPFISQPVKEFRYIFIKKDIRCKQGRGWDTSTRGEMPNQGGYKIRGSQSQLRCREFLAEGSESLAFSTR